MRAGAGWRGRVLAAAVAGAVMLAGCAVDPAPAAPRHQHQHWRLVWTDSFSGPAGSPVSAANWRYNTGRTGWGNNEVEKMTSSTRNVQLDGRGALDIIALGHGRSWTSGHIQTRRYFDAPAGGLLRVTASLRQPDPDSGLGYWPAFWLVGPGEWPQHGEIDILEDVNGLSRHSGTLHCGNLTDKNPDGTTGPCHEPAGIGTDLLPCAGCQTGFHTYSVIVDRLTPGDESIHWFLDHREFYSLNERQVGTAAWNEAMSGGFSIIFDVAMGGAYPDSACNCTTPTDATTPGGTLTVRYVSVFTRR